MTFLPKDYEVPVQEGNYMRFEKGDNLFRVLDSAVIGWEYWNTDNKPVRLKTAPKTTPEDIRQDDEGNPGKIKHFWAFPVWNYKTERVQILEITQSTVQAAIKSLIDDSDWGMPFDYDIKVSKTGEKFETKYSVNPKPHSPLKDNIKEAYEEIDLNLQALFDGGNPFGNQD